MPPKAYKTWLIILATILLASISYKYWDIPVALYFNAHRTTFAFAEFITKLGGGLEISIILSTMIFIAYLRKNSSIMFQLIFVLILFALIGLTNNIVKVIFARARPIEYFEHAVYGFQFFKIGYHFASFPSGHTMAIVSLCAGLAGIWQKYRALFFSTAAIVAFSRVVVCAHYLSDVIVGFVFSLYLVHYFTSIQTKLPFGNLFCARQVGYKSRS